MAKNMRFDGRVPTWGGPGRFKGATGRAPSLPRQNPCVIESEPIPQGVGTVLVTAAGRRWVTAPVSSLARGLCLIALAAAGAAHADTVKFHNGLSGCAALSVAKTWTQSNLVLAYVDVALRKSIGECGCFSALATYTSSVNRGGVRQELQKGLVNFMAGGEKTLVLATDPALVAGQEVQVQVACTEPL